MSIYGSFFVSIVCQHLEWPKQKKQPQLRMMDALAKAVFCLIQNLEIRGFT